MTTACIVGVSSCLKQIPKLKTPYACTPFPDTDTILNSCNVLPLLIPPLGGDTLIKSGILDKIDGLWLTGSISNVEPSQYGKRPLTEDLITDPARDATMLPLIRAAVAKNIPILALCRGCQEFNVAFGGTLFQKVHRLQGMFDHRADLTKPYEQAFAPAHYVKLTEGGILQGLAQDANIEMKDNCVMVNSSHAQGVDKLGPGLEVEAVALDGLIEAFTVKDSGGFTLAVQWHPEVFWRENPLSKAIFASFSAAVKDYAKHK